MIGINHITALEGSGNLSPSPAKTSNNDQMMGKDDFLKLLLVQLEKQDPLNPVMDHEFVAQMAQFSSLEQLLQMNKSLSQFVAAQQYTQLGNLIGKEATFIHPETGGEYQGEITGVRFGENPILIIDDLEIRLDQLVAVRKIDEEQPLEMG